jgi:hypothetical protein
VQADQFNNPQGGGAFGPALQFDTKGVEFGPWVRRFVAQVKGNWMIPYAAMSMRGRVVITFNVHKNGFITDLAVIGPSPVEAFNQAYGRRPRPTPRRPCRQMHWRTGSSRSRSSTTKIRDADRSQQPGLLALLLVFLVYVASVSAGSDDASAPLARRPSAEDGHLVVERRPESRSWRWLPGPTASGKSALASRSRRRGRRDHNCDSTAVSMAISAPTVPDVERRGIRII